MDTAEFQQQLPTFEPALGPNAVRLRYDDRQPWDSIGTHVLDRELTRLANFYGNCNAAQRKKLRSSLDPLASWGLIAYVRRMSVQILHTKDEAWLRSALNIASLENATFDYRDSIVSLVIARAASESVSIDAKPYFDKAIKLSSAEMKPTLINARDHRPKDVRDLLREFGPPELKPQRKKRTS
jgi:hypothetical protein